MKDIQRFKNLVDVLESELKASPFSIEEWEDQDREIVRLTNAIRHIKTFAGADPEIIGDMCTKAIFGIDITNFINTEERKG